jgi:SAM-dependent methyltransferase
MSDATATVAPGRDALPPAQADRLRALILDSALAAVPLSGRRILDAGSGLFAAAEQARGADVTTAGADAATRLPHDDASFDVVVSADVVHRSSDPERAVRELARVVAPGGTVVVTTPGAALPPAARIAAALGRGGRRAAGRRVGRAEVRRWLELRGLEVVEERGFAPGGAGSRLDGYGATRAGRAILPILMVARKPSAAA